eukprot:Skav201741  [mRNA]  locus=scaffold2498:357059:359761:+ [translate_table: standard]
MLRHKKAKHDKTPMKGFSFKAGVRVKESLKRAHAAVRNKAAMSRILKGKSSRHKVTFFKWPAWWTNRENRQDVLCSHCKRLGRSVQELDKSECKVDSSFIGSRRQAFLNKLQELLSTESADRAPQLKEMILQLTFTEQRAAGDREMRTFVKPTWMKLPRADNTFCVKCKRLACMYKSLADIPCDGPLPAFRRKRLFDNMAKTAGRSKTRRKEMKQLMDLKPVSTDTWIAAFPQSAFDVALVDGDIETAWNILNSCANKTLTVDNGFPHPFRGKDRTPRPVPRPHLKANRLLTFQERKLRRFRRQLLEYQVHCRRGRFNLQLHNNLWRRWTQLSVHHDSLQSLNFADPNSIGVIEQCISNLEQRAQNDSLQAWQNNRISLPDAALFQWVRREASDSVFTDGVPLHPQAKVEHFQNEWQRMWNRAPRTAADLQPWLVGLPSGTWNDQLTFSGTELRQLTWLRRERPLAQMAGACLAKQQVPQDGLHIRCVLVPKPEGGLRPISVACLAWRIGMSSILQQLQPWLDSWLPPFLLGGLKHRDAREAHELLHHDIFQALQTHRKFFGAKLDIRKCFDSVSPLQAIHVWDHLQAPPEVTGLLRFFYSFSVWAF